MRVLVGAFSAAIVARVISHTTVCSATHQKIRDIINKIKNLFLHVKKSCCRYKCSYQFLDIVPGSLDFLSSSGWHSADQRKRGKAISVGLHNLGKSHFPFFLWLGRI